MFHVNAVTADETFCGRLTIVPQIRALFLLVVRKCSHGRRGESSVHEHRGISDACMCMNTPPILPRDELSRFSSLHAKILLLRAFEPNGKINARGIVALKENKSKISEQKGTRKVLDIKSDNEPVHFIEWNGIYLSRLFLEKLMSPQQEHRNFQFCDSLPR